MFVANDVEFLPFVQARLKRDDDVGVEVQVGMHTGALRAKSKSMHVKSRTEKKSSHKSHVCTSCIH